MASRLNAYSLLEIILVTTFIIIFLVVVNPGTYIDRFSGMLLKMKVLNESEVMINKFMAVSMGACLPQGLLASEFLFLTNDGNFSIQFDSFGQLLIKNVSAGSEALLYRHVDANELNEFVYRDALFSFTGSPSNVGSIDLFLHSSLVDHQVLGSLVCDDHQVVLREF